MSATYAEAVELYVAEICGDPFLCAVPGIEGQTRRRIERDGLPADALQRFGVGAMEPLGSVMGRAITRDVSDDEALKAFAAPVECATCSDFGYVRLPVERHDSRFGQAQPCPGCNGKVEKQRNAEARRQEHRREWPLPAHVLNEAWRGFETGHFAHALGDEAQIASAEQQLANARQSAKSYAADPRHSLVLSGPSGNGKTTLAAKIAAIAWRNGSAVAWLTGAELQRLAYNWERDRGAESERNIRMRSWGLVDLLVIDEADHAVHGDKLELGLAALFELVDCRLNCGLPTVLTANALSESLEKTPTGRAIVSRLRSAGTTWIDMSAVPDARPYYAVEF